MEITLIFKGIDEINLKDSNILIVLKTFPFEFCRRHLPFQVISKSDKKKISRRCQLMFSIRNQSFYVNCPIKTVNPNFIIRNQQEYILLDFKKRVLKDGDFIAINKFIYEVRISYEYNNSSADECDPTLELKVEEGLQKLLDDESLVSTLSSLSPAKNYKDEYD